MLAGGGVELEQARRTFGGDWGGVGGWVGEAGMGRGAAPTEPCESGKSPSLALAPSLPGSADYVSVCVCVYIYIYFFYKYP